MSSASPPTDSSHFTDTSSNCPCCFFTFPVVNELYLASAAPLDVLPTSTKIAHFGSGNSLSIPHCNAAHDRSLFIASTFNPAISAASLNDRRCDCDANGGTAITASRIRPRPASSPIFIAYSSVIATNSSTA